MMKKLLGIVVLGLLLSGNVYAGSGSDCELEVDSAVRDKEYGRITFKIYNPTSKAINVIGVKYFKSDNTLWREFRDLRKEIWYKRSETIVHGVEIPFDNFRYRIMC